MTYAQAQANAGAAIVRLLANATLEMGDVSASGHLNRHALIDQDTQALGITFICETGDLSAAVAEGASVTVDGASHRVRSRTDSAATGQSTLVLARL